jgi:glucose-1-phosphate cytidylyltransferase
MDTIKTIILAGGAGTRLAEETIIRPKPMVEIGGRPILWHILSIFAAHGHRDFIIACGYKGELIKEFFTRFALHASDIVVDLKEGKVTVEKNRSPDWRVALVDTGVSTQTGGRLLRLKSRVAGGTFMMTYGDSVANIDLAALLAFHRAHGKLATLTAVRPPARFGGIIFDGDRVAQFSEKPQIGEGWVNGGFMVLEPGVLDYITGDDTVFEGGPLERLSTDGQLMAYRHTGFWQPMDTLREKSLLEKMWQDSAAPWKVW